MTYLVGRRQITEITPPAVEPVSLAEMKVHVREDYGDNDTILVAMIKAARQWVEKEYQLSLVQRTYRADVEGFASRFRLPNPPLSSITSIKYYTPDSPQVLTTLDADNYRHDLGRSEIYLSDSYSIPSTATRHNAVQITYVAGYEPSTDSPQDFTTAVPWAIKAAIKIQAAELFEQREASTPLKVTQLPTTKMLLAPWREY